MKIALGGQEPTEGTVTIAGTPLTFSRPAESRRLGLGMVLQERSLIRTLSGLDNIFLNAERTSRIGIIQRRAEEREAAGLCQRVGISRSVLRKTASEMSPVQQMCSSSMNRQHRSPNKRSGPSSRQSATSR
jgi:ABC-type sugar transport system ATPase subunit